MVFPFISMWISLLSNLTRNGTPSHVVGLLPFMSKKKKKMSFSHPQTFLSSSTCPEIHGHLHAKEPSKKSWKKLYFILRRSGLYVSSKGTSKVSVSDVNGDNADFYYVSPQRRRWFFSIIIPLLLPHERFLIFWFICVALQGQQQKKISGCQASLSHMRRRDCTLAAAHRPNIGTGIEKKKKKRFLLSG